MMANPPFPPSSSPSVSIQLVAGGDVSDYTPSVTNSIATTFANQAGVPVSDVTVTVTSASVAISVDIRAADASAANAVSASLASVTSSAAAASTFLAAAQVQVISAPQVSTTVGNGVCINTCNYVSDNDCDDGGHGSEYGICDICTDCVDCGPRDAATCASSPPAPTQSGFTCLEFCNYSSDNDCDDGGYGSEYAVCAICTDCDDCGPRPSYACTASPPPLPSGSPGCYNSCWHSSDNDCDDGGAGSEYGLCDRCHDCDDCGPRPASQCVSAGYPPAPPTNLPPVCIDNCNYASDNDCDDGGHGSEYAVCDICSDCADCGPRPASICSGSGGGGGGGGGCTNTCNYASDNDCDDSGPGSEYSMCALGTDCVDCGPRGGGGGGTGNGCSDTCYHASDNDCDDGGSGSEYGLCDVCTDCDDCGPRPASICSSSGGGGTGVPGCYESCFHASDNDCDDGGQGSEYGLCDACSDCDDCGPRPLSQCTTSPPPAGGGGGCTETCNYASDGDCDDSGPGSEYSMCTLGTDCTDCRRRPRRRRRHRLGHRRRRLHLLHLCFGARA